MKRVTGIGGLFFKCQDVEKMKSWYDRHLGIPAEKYGATFEWRLSEDPTRVAYTAWSTFPQDTKYFAPSEKPFMFNYRVENLEKLMELLREEGVEIVGEMQVYDYGKFGWIMDPEGNKIELWEPINKVFEESEGDKAVK